MNYEGINSYCRSIKKNSKKCIPLPTSIFRSTIDETKRSIKRNPYTFNKDCIQYHKVAFFFLGFLFFALSAILCFWKTNWIYSHYFINASFLKSALAVISLGLASACFSFGWMLRIENELILRFYARAKKRLRKAYWQELAENDAVAVQLKMKYQALLESLTLHKDDALQLAKQISQSKVYDNISKERLYNQVISDLNTKLKAVITQFC